MPTLAAAALQILALVVVLAAVHRPFGDYMARTLTAERHTRFERGIYRVDEALRFRPNQSSRVAVVKGVLATIWFAVAYVLRIYVNLLIETGFTLGRLEEWSASAAEVAAHPDWAGANERPSFLLIAAQR